jgi:hypothetical protein
MRPDTTMRVFRTWERTCETCEFLNEESTPCECKKGRGRVAYLHPACEDYKEELDAEN